MVQVSNTEIQKSIEEQFPHRCRNKYVLFKYETPKITGTKVKINEQMKFYQIKSFCSVKIKRLITMFRAWGKL